MILGIIFIIIGILFILDRNLFIKNKESKKNSNIYETENKNYYPKQIQIDFKDIPTQKQNIIITTIKEYDNSNLLKKETIKELIFVINKENNKNLKYENITENSYFYNNNNKLQKMESQFKTNDPNPKKSNFIVNFEYENNNIIKKESFFYENQNSFYENQNSLKTQDKPFEVITYKYNYKSQMIEQNTSLTNIINNRINNFNIKYQYNQFNNISREDHSSQFNSYIEYNYDKKIYWNKKNYNFKPPHMMEIHLTKEIHYVYNEKNQLKEIIEKNIPNNRVMTTIYIYDQKGNLTEKEYLNNDLFLKNTIIINL